MDTGLRAQANGALADGASDHLTCSSLESSASLCLAPDLALHAGGGESLPDRPHPSTARGAYGASPLGPKSAAARGATAEHEPQQPAESTAAFASLHSIWDAPQAAQPASEADAHGRAALGSAAAFAAAASQPAASPAASQTQQVRWLLWAKSGILWQPYVIW
jgi:hypothetical protein